jgi:hypothetical protein
VSPATAYAIWIIGEALFSVALVVAIWSITRDTVRAWPRVVALFTEEDMSDDDA